MITDEQVAELKALFERVENKQDWKNPIDATIVLQESEVEKLREAIIFYTGSVPTFKRISTNVQRVVAAGYYATMTGA